MSDLLERILGNKKRIAQAMTDEDPVAPAPVEGPREIIQQFRAEQSGNPDLEFVQFMRRRKPKLDIMEVARQLDAYAKQTGRVTDSSFVPPRPELQYRVNNPEGSDW